MLGAATQNPLGQIGAMYQPVSDPTQTKLPQVEQGHQSCEKYLDALDAIISNLEARLQPVLRIEPATPLGSGLSLPKAVTTYDRLNEHAQVIKVNASRLSELLRLLEL